MATANHFELKAEKRHDIGKGASRRLRREQEKLPAIIYGADKAPQSIMLGQNELFHALENEAFYSHILTLHVDGSKEQVVLKALQRHPTKPKILHADFMRVNAKEKLRMQVPLHFIGGDVAPGVKQRGGIVSHSINDIEITCLPNALPEFIEVDLSAMELDQTLHLSDIQLPKGVEFVTAPEAGSESDHPVAAIHLPRAQAAAGEETSAEEAEGGSGEAAEGNE